MEPTIKKRAKPTNRLPAKRKEHPHSTPTPSPATNLIQSRTSVTAATATPPASTFGARVSDPVVISKPPVTPGAPASNPTAKVAPSVSSRKNQSVGVQGPSILKPTVSPIVTPVVASSAAVTVSTQIESDICPTSDAVPDVNLDSKEPYYIDPVVPVPPCKKPRLAPPGARMQSTKDILGYDSQHPYVERWVRMSLLERKGDVRFQVVRNDGRRESLLLVLGLKNVFVKQLPNMPRPYVSRLIFDRKHESLALLKKDDKFGKHIVMGGCCYRPFKDQGFAEIAFLAISQSEQVRGYGTRLMAQTKERAKRLGLTHLLTCADNNAVPYFKKQGFSKKITLPFDRWQGYIKDYDGVTLMECILHEKVDYLNIPLLLKAQKMALVEKMKEISNAHIVFPGIDISARAGLKIEEIPGLKDVISSSESCSGRDVTASGRATAGLADRDKTSQEILQKHLQSVLTQIKSHNCAWPFLEPVNAQETGAFDYYDVIKNPMDLSTIQNRLDSGWFYVTKEIFIADLKRMVKNCVEYNGKNHYVTEMALQLEKVFLNKI